MNTLIPDHDTRHGPGGPASLLSRLLQLLDPSACSQDITRLLALGIEVLRRVELRLAHLDIALPAGGVGLVPQGASPYLVIRPRVPPADAGRPSPGDGCVPGEARRDEPERRPRPAAPSLRVQADHLRRLRARGGSREHLVRQRPGARGIEAHLLHLGGELVARELAGPLRVVLGDGVLDEGPGAPWMRHLRVLAPLLEADHLAGLLCSGLRLVVGDGALDEAPGAAARARRGRLRTRCRRCRRRRQRLLRDGLRPRGVEPGLLHLGRQLVARQLAGALHFVLGDGVLDEVPRAAALPILGHQGSSPARTASRMRAPWWPMRFLASSISCTLQPISFANSWLDVMPFSAARSIVRSGMRPGSPADAMYARSFSSMTWRLRASASSVSAA